VLFEKHREGLFDCLLLAAPDELHGALESKLHDSCKRVLKGWLDVDVEHSSPSEVCAAAGRAIAMHDQQRLADVVGRLRQNAGRGERAALGLDDVLSALCEVRVETLVVNGGYSEPGLVCPHGDWIVARDGGTCPVHGVALQPVADVVEAAIECAVRQGARIISIDRGDPLAERNDDGSMRDREEFLGIQALGSIAAVVRFDLDEGAKSTGPVQFLTE
jgi:peptide subunit release factor 1 (eRF1)